MSTTESIPSADTVRATVTAYMAALESGSSTTIAALYADDATVEDPVGSEPKVGRKAITTFYSALDGTSQKTELLAVKISGANAAFHFRVTTPVGGTTYEVEPIDVMTFDGEGRITSMRAFWSPADMRQL